MSAAEKETVLSKVTSSPLPKRRVLRELDIPKEHILPVAQAAAA